MKFELIFSAGGTGGHIFPALSVANYLNNPVLLLTGRYGMEKKILKKEKIPFKTLPIKGISGVNLGKKLFRFPGIFISLLVSLYYLLKFKPKVVVGFGGYASFPVLFWSKILKIKYFLQEQNSFPGQVTRIFSSKAEAIFMGFPDIPLEGNKIFTGNPLRKEFYEIPAKEKIDFPLNIFIIGGSQGSNFLDETIKRIIPHLKEFPLKIYHQAREESISSLKEKYNEYGIEHKIFDFVENPWEFYRQADLLICRAGALTVSEVISSGRCAIFVPFKGAAENHQYYNGLFLSRDNSAFMVEENEKAGEKILNILKEVSEKPEILLEMGKKAKEKEVKNGMEIIRKHLLESLKGGRGAF